MESELAAVGIFRSSVGHRCRLCASNADFSDATRHSREPRHSAIAERFALIFDGRLDAVRCRVCAADFHWKDLAEHARLHRLTPWYAPSDRYRIFFENRVVERATRFYCLACEELFAEWSGALAHTEEARHATLVEGLPKRWTHGSTEMPYELLVKEDIVAGTDETFSCDVCKRDGIAARELAWHCREARHVKSKMNFDVETQETMRKFVTPRRHDENGCDSAAKNGLEAISFKDFFAASHPKEKKVLEDFFAASHPEEKRGPEASEDFFPASHPKEKKVLEDFFAASHPEEKNGPEASEDFFPASHPKEKKVPEASKNLLRESSPKKGFEAISSKNFFPASHPKKKEPEDFFAASHPEEKKVPEASEDFFPASHPKEKKVPEASKNLLRESSPKKRFEAISSDNFFLASHPKEKKVPEDFFPASHPKKKEPEDFFAASHREEKKVPEASEDFFPASHPKEKKVPEASKNLLRESSPKKRFEAISSDNFFLAAHPKEKKVPEDFFPASHPKKKEPEDFFAASHPEEKKVPEASKNLLRESSPKKSLEAISSDNFFPELASTAYIYVWQYDDYYRCELCDCVLTDFDSVERHLRGFSHSACFEARGCSGILLDAACHDNYCKLCDCRVLGVSNVVSHVTGSRHTASLSRKSLSSEEEKPAEVSFATAPLPEDHIVKRGDYVYCRICNWNVVPNSTDDHVTGVRHERSIEQFYEHITVRDDNYRCGCCDCVVRGLAGLYNHLKSYRHRTTLKEMNTVRHEDVEEAIEKSIDETIDRHIFRSVNNDFRCKICDCPVAKEQINAHVDKDQHSDAAQRFEAFVTRVKSDKYRCEACRCTIRGLDNVYLHLNASRHRNAKAGESQETEDTSAVNVAMTELKLAVDS